MEFVLVLNCEPNTQRKWNRREFEQRPSGLWYIIHLNSYHRLINLL